MPRKNILLPLLLLILAVIMTTACAGPIGPEGTQGSTGPAGPQGPAGPPGKAASVRLEYVGSEKCSQCHEDAYSKFMLSGHPYKLTQIENGQAPVFPYDAGTGGVQSPPEGYTWDNVSYVIGGFGWKARFIDQDGFIITGDENSATQWNYANEAAGIEAGWVPYHAGEELPYDCGSCHTTGYRAEGHQDDKEGIIGTWEYPGIQCEECHGPGNLHASDPYGYLMQIDRSSQLCGECHIRGDVSVVDASGGFINHHEQYEEMFSSKHFAISCVACHDPHSSAIYSDEALNPSSGITQECTTCHFDALEAKTKRHFFAECVDCHMPLMGKSASGDLDLLTGDIRTHLFAINPDYNAPQFTDDGSAAMPYITLEYACNHCHGVLVEEKSPEAMEALARDYHSVAP